MATGSGSGSARVRIGDLRGIYSVPDEPGAAAATPALQPGWQRINQGIQMTSRDSFVSDASVCVLRQNRTQR